LLKLDHILQAVWKQISSLVDWIRIVS